MAVYKLLKIIQTNTFNLIITGSASARIVEIKMHNLENKI